MSMSEEVQPNRRSLGRMDFARVYPLLMAAIVCVGIAVRLRAYLFNRSLWLDEASLALPVLERTFSALVFEPLIYQPSAPVGFLAAQKLVTQIFGGSEYALRLVPLLSGILALGLFAYLAKRCLPPTAALIAVGLFALSDSLIYYSTEAKQYSCDVAVALLLCCFTVYYESRPSSRIRLFLMGLSGVVAVWLSFPTVFVLPGLALYLVTPRLKKKDRGEIWRLCLVFLFWAVSFGAYYVVSLRNLAVNPILLTYWKDGFWPIPPKSISDLLWPAQSFLRLFYEPGSLHSPGLITLLLVVGCASIFTKRREVLLILMVPMLLALIASAFQKYPFRGRVMVFAVPAILWLISEGAGALIDGAKYNRVVIGLTVVALLFFYPVELAGVSVVKPRTRQEIRPVMGYVKDHWQSEDHLYLYYSSVVPFKFYESRYGFGGGDYTVGAPHRENWSKYEADLARVRGRGRLWVVFSHVYGRDGTDEEQFILNYLDSLGTRLDAIKETGASAYLYDLSQAEPDG